MNDQDKAYGSVEVESAFTKEEGHCELALVGP